MQDELSQNPRSVKRVAAPASYPPMLPRRNVTVISRWLIAITERQVRRFDAHGESIDRAYGWNEWNGADDGKKMYPNINEPRKRAQPQRGSGNYLDAA